MPLKEFRERCTGENGLVFLSVPSALAWALMVFAGVCYGLQFFDETRLDVDAPTGSASWRAERVLQASFSQKLTAYPFKLAVVVSSKNPTPSSRADGPAVAELTRLVINGTLGACDADAHRTGVCWWRAAHGLFTPSDPAAAALERSDFLSDDARASMIVMTSNSGFYTGSPYELSVWSQLQGIIDGWLATHAAAFDVGVTQEQMLLNDAQAGAIHDFEAGDIITLPIAFVLLAVACGTPALLGLVTLAVTLLSTFYILHQIATGNWFCKGSSCPGTPSVQFPGFFPAILVNMSLAVSLDYTLFILTRYREEARVPGVSPLGAVVATLRSAGRVILVSGLTLATTFCGLTFCSEPVVNSIGWGGTIAICVAMLVHLTLLPVLLFFCAELCAPCCRPFRRLRLPGLRARKWSSRPERPLAEMDATVAADGDATATVAAGGEASGVSARAASASHAHDRPLASLSGAPPAFPPLSMSVWVRLALVCRDHRLKVLLANLLLLAPFALLCSWLSISTTQAMLTPRTSSALRTLDSMPALGLSPGVLNPLRVITYNLHVEAPPLGCADDDLDVRQYLEGLHLPELHGVPPEDISCDALNRLLDGRFCDAARAPWIGHNSTSCGTPITPLVRRFCPGTCANYCSPEVRGPMRNRSVLVDSFFEATTKFRRALETQLGLHPLDIRDVVTMPGGNRSVPISASEARRLLERAGALEREPPATAPHAGQPSSSDADATAYAAQFAHLVNFNRSAALIEIVLPRGQASDVALVRRIRELAASPAHADSGFGFLVSGDIPGLLDAVDGVMKQAAAILGGTTAVVVVLFVGIAFRSLLIPMRLVLTIAATLLFTTGATVLTYQVLGGWDGIYWVVTVACGCLVIGLTIDYDVFLIARCHELRHLGFTSEAAIIRGLDSSAPTITMAGLIMTVAFSSLLFSSTVVLNQWGCMLVIASLYDTFIVRSLLVPSLMFFLVEANWWPGRVPPPTRNINGVPISPHVN